MPDYKETIARLEQEIKDLKQVINEDEDIISSLTKYIDLLESRLDIDPSNFNEMTIDSGIEFDNPDDVDWSDIRSDNDQLSFDFNW